MGIKAKQSKVPKVSQASGRKGKMAKKQAPGKGRGKRISARKKLESSSSSSSDSSEDSSSSSSSSDESSADEPDAIRDLDGVDLRKSRLHKIIWKRVIIDEAHKIKGRTNNTAKSVLALRSFSRWCLTGTPLQNRIGELHSLIGFLRVKPFAWYYCKAHGCECTSLHWNFGPKQRKCTICGHTPMQHYSYFNKMVL